MLAAGLTSRSTGPSDRFWIENEKFGTDVPGNYGLPEHHPAKVHHLLPLSLARIRGSPARARAGAGHQRHSSSAGDLGHLSETDYLSASGSLPWSKLR